MGNQQTVASTNECRVVIQTDDDLWKIEEIDDDPPVCLFTSVKQYDRCTEGIKILRVLRHPNILKFISSNPSSDKPSFYSELAYPLQPCLSLQKLEGVVRGWRDIGCGLDFIHTKVGLSLNNLHIGCVFVGGQDSKWKIGGFELACKQNECTKQFFALVTSIRHRDAIPPEDDDDEQEGRGGVNILPATTPIHSRDTWAFGNLMLQTIEELSDEEDIPDEIVYYINNQMLNQSPELRPPATQILNQPWMKNATTHIIDFLTNLTLKKQPNKDEFFKSLAFKLHSLPSDTVAEHIVPLLMTPLVMAEPVASEHLWQHVFCPVSADHKRNNEFKPTEVNPLLDESQFKCHVLPLLLNLLESRDYHVRLILLHHLHFFCYLCTQEDLSETVLPEILVGLKDSHEDIVVATLHALAELVPLVGSSVVMGTARKNVFVDNRPNIQGMTGRVHIATQSDKKGKKALTGSLFPKKTPPTGSKDTNSNSSSPITLHAHEETISYPVIPHDRQFVGKYSPSASIADDSINEHLQREKEEKDEDYDVDDHDNEEWEDFGNSKMNPDDGFNTSDWGSWNTEENDKANTGEIPDKPVLVSPLVPSQQKSSSFKLSLGKKEGSQETSSTKSTPVAESDLRRKLKGQLSEEDIKRLEEKAQWSSSTVDLFADMAPKFTKTVRHDTTDNTSMADTSELFQRSVSSGSSSVGIVGTTSTSATNTTQLQITLTPQQQKDQQQNEQVKSTQIKYTYNPPESEVEESAWDTEEWGDNDL